MSGDLARAHAPRVHPDDLVVEAREAGLPFGYDLRFERPIAIPRRLERQLAEVAFQGFGSLAVTRVAAVVAGLVVFRIAEMIGHLGLHGPLQQRFRELLQQPVFANDVFGLLVVRQQFVNEVEVDGHRISLVSFFRWPFTQSNLYPHSGLSGDSIQRVVRPTVTADGEKAPALKFGHPRVMALLLALTLFHHLIDGFQNRHLRVLVADLLGVPSADYTATQMTYDLRRLRLKGLIFRPPRTHRYFLTPYGWKVARLFARLEAKVFRPAVAMFTGNDAVLPFPLRASLDRVDAQLDELIYQAFPQSRVA